jgi:hypothetical protein
MSQPLLELPRGVEGGVAARLVEATWPGLVTDA